MTVTPVSIKMITTNPSTLKRIGHQPQMTSVTEKSSSEKLSVNLVDLNSNKDCPFRLKSLNDRTSSIYMNFIIAAPDPITVDYLKLITA